MSSPSTIQPPPTGLPVEEVVPDLRAALASGNAAVLEAPPGAGKTTVLPLRLLDESWLAGRRILMLEPRRLAARAAATRMAALIGEAPGGSVGYAMRFERRLGAGTRVEVVTEGLLTRRLQADPALEAYGLVIFDEFHERSLDADLGLALCLEVQELRPDLRLLLMSATLDHAALARTLGEVPCIQSGGRLFPVTVDHLTPGAGEPLEATVVRALEQVAAQGAGGVLVFLPGAREIRRAGVALAASAARLGFGVHALHGELPRDAQAAALRPPAPGERKLVLATNLAETSLTIEGVTAVIDAGLERRPRFSPRTGMSRLVTVPISRASAEQRRGRAGRLGPGTCLRLWPAEADRARPAQRPAEIEEADLAPLCLELAAWGVADPARMRFPTPPPAGPYAQARGLLQELQALDEAGATTAHGRAMSNLPLHPRLAHMVLHARAHGLLPTALAVAAMLSGRDPDPSRADADLARRVGSGSRESPAAREAERVVGQLAGVLRAPRGRPSPDQVGIVVALAYPDRVARARSGTAGGFQLANGRGARLDPQDALAGEPWLAVAELEDGVAEGRIRLAAALDLASLEAVGGARLVTQEEVGFDPRTDSVLARRVLRLGAIAVSEQPLVDAEPARIAAALCDGIRARGLRVLPWSSAARQLQARVSLLRALEPERWPDLGDERLAANLEAWLGPWVAGRRRLADLGGLDLTTALRARLDHARQQEVERRLPPAVEVPSGRRVPVDYTVDPPALAVRVQELFGLVATPAVDGGRLALALHLLSPAQRPVAVTRDLPGFWRTGYPAVRKELRGRYPKHPWPEDPRTAPATRGTRPKG